MTPPDPFVRCTEVTFSYRAADGPVTALDRVTFEGPARGVTVVAGRSGSGKSTLLRLLAGLERPDTGRITVNGSALDAMSARQRRAFRRRSVGYLHQRPADNLIGDLTVGEHLRHAAALHNRTVDIDAALNGVGLHGRGADRPAALSGGEQQRLALACVLVAEPPLILADEPSAHLDTAATTVLLDLLAGTSAAASGVVIASHDRAIIDRAESVVHLDYGHAR